MDEGLNTILQQIRNDPKTLDLLDEFWPLVSELVFKFNQLPQTAENNFCLLVTCMLIGHNAGCGNVVEGA